MTNSANATLPITSISKSNDGCVLTASDYNVDNMSANSSHLPAVASHIVNVLLAPEIMFLQEIQDDDGATDDGVVTANGTLQTLVDAIKATSNGSVGPCFADDGTIAYATQVVYSFTEVLPVNDEDGGEPGAYPLRTAPFIWLTKLVAGGNIRPAYLYLADRVTLVSGTVGGPLDANEAFIDTEGRLDLMFNPGRIDPTNEAWNASRKPIAALWEKVNQPSDRFVTVNVHLTSKLDGESEQGDARPPVNSEVDQRTSQVDVLKAFAQSIIALDSNASIIISGDWNEFSYTDAVFNQLDGVLQEADEVVGLPLAER